MNLDIDFFWILIIKYNKMNQFFNNPKLNFKDSKEIWRFFCLSDLQIPHMNLLKYEEEARLLLPGILDSLWNEITKDTLDTYSKEEKNQFLIKSVDFILDQYFNHIKENIDSFDTFIDLWDFIFNISSSKIKELEVNWHLVKLQSIFDYLKNNDKKRILVLGNHDHIEYDKFYKDFFDEIIPNIFLINEKERKLDIFCHYPLTTKEYDYRNKKWLPGFNMGIPDLSKKFSSLKEKGFIITDNHWHVHSTEVMNECKFWIDYNNCCIDYLLLQKKRP